MTDVIAADPLMTVAETAALFRVHPRTIGLWARRGLLGRVVQPARLMRFHKANIMHAYHGGQFDQKGNPI